MRTISLVIAILLGFALIPLRAAPADAEQLYRSAWGCVLAVGSPQGSSEERARVSANAGATCRRKTRFDVMSVMIMRDRRGARDEVVAVDRTPEYFYVEEPFGIDLPEAWGAWVKARTWCRERWMVSDPRFYTRAVFKKAEQSKRVVMRTSLWGGRTSTTCRDVRSLSTSSPVSDLPSGSLSSASTTAAAVSGSTDV